MDDFWEKLILAIAGPLVTAGVGGLVVGWITRLAQERRADNQLKEERLRAQNQLRLQLISQMTEAASSLYMATQNFWRKKERENVGNDVLNQQRVELDQQYRTSRVIGEVIESRLEAYFLSTDQKTNPKTLWHATMDLLTVRYFTVIGLVTEQLLKDNAGDKHSGLSVEELKIPKTVLDTYHLKLHDCVQQVLQGPIKPWA
jgi:hypothetical protein